MKCLCSQKGQQLLSQHISGSQAGVEGPDPLLMIPTKHLLGCLVTLRVDEPIQTHSDLQTYISGNAGVETRMRSREEGVDGKDTFSMGFQKGCPSPRLGSHQRGGEQVQADSNMALDDRAQPQLSLVHLLHTGWTLSSLLPSTLQGEAAEQDRSCHLVP